MPVEGPCPAALAEVDAFGYERLMAPIGTSSSREIAGRTGKEAEAVLGHVQQVATPRRSSRPTRFWIHAVDALHEGRSGQMVALHGTNIELVPLWPRNSSWSTPR